MALEIFKLVGSIFVDTDKANASMAKTEKKAANFGQTLGKAAGIAVGVGTAVAGMATAAGGAMLSMANDAAQVADEIDKASIRMGVTTKAYQEMSFAAERCGVQTAELEKAAKKLEGTDLNLEDAMNQIMALSTAEERATMAADLFGEKIAYNLSPLIEQSQDDYDGLIQRASELGLIMSDDAVKSGVKFGDLMSDLKQQVKRLGTSLGTELVPILSDMVTLIIGYMPQVQALIGKIAPLASNFITELIPPMITLAGELLPVLIDAVQQILPSLSSMVSSILPTIITAVQTLLPPLVNVVGQILPALVNIIGLFLPIINTVLKFLAPILSLVLKLVQPLIRLVTAILTPILELVTQLLEPILAVIEQALDPLIGIVESLLTILEPLISVLLEPLAELILLLIEPLTVLLTSLLIPILTALEQGLTAIAPQATAFLTNISNGIKNVVGIINDNVFPVVDGIKEKLDGFTSYLEENFVENFKSIWQGISDFFGEMWEGLVNTLKSGVNTWIKILNGVINGINAIAAPIATLSGKAAIAIPSIPMLANGGTINKSGTVLVGEKGPEFLNLPTGASVTPLDKATQIDYDKMTQSFIKALREVAPELQSNVEISADSKGIFKAVKNEDKIYRKSTGRSAFA